MRFLPIWDLCVFHSSCVWLQTHHKSTTFQLAWLVSSSPLLFCTYMVEFLFLWRTQVLSVNNLVFIYFYAPVLKKKKRRNHSPYCFTHLESPPHFSTFANLPGYSRFHGHLISCIEDILACSLLYQPPSPLNPPLLWCLSSHQDVTRGYLLHTFSIICCFSSPSILFHLLDYAFLASEDYTLILNGRASLLDSI